MTKLMVISVIVLTLIAGIAFVGFSLLNRNVAKKVDVVPNIPAIVSSPSSTLSPEQKAAVSDQQTKQDIGKIAFALQAYYVGHSTYPSQAQGIVHLVLDKKLEEVSKPFMGIDSYYYFVDPRNCLGNEANPCTDVYVSGLLSSEGHLNMPWCWDSKSNQARETTSCQP